MCYQPFTMHVNKLLMWLLLIQKISMDLACQKVQVVKMCPRNEDEWNARAIAHDCPKTKENDEYHCVIDATGMKLIELCAPSVPVSGSSCAEYNEVGRRIHTSEIKCGNELVPCPYTYDSREAYKYQSCYDEVQTRIKDCEKGQRVESKEEDHSGSIQRNKNPNPWQTVEKCI